MYCSAVSSECRPLSTPRWSFPSFPLFCESIILSILTLSPITLLRVSSTALLCPLLVPSDAIFSHCRQSYQGNPPRDLPQNTHQHLTGLQVNQLFYIHTRQVEIHLSTYVRGLTESVQRYDSKILEVKQREQPSIKILLLTTYLI